MTIKQLDAGAAARDVPVHLVPAMIEHNGPAAVDAYFRPRETGASVDGLPVLTCNLRGRNLAGVRLPLPQDYAGVVLECNQRDAAQAAGSSQDAEAAAEAGPITTWAATSVFSHLHYYNHDAAPLRGDGLRRCLEWAELSARVHAPVDPAAVTAAMADGSAAQLRTG